MLFFYALLAAQSTPSRLSGCDFRVREPTWFLLLAKAISFGAEAITATVWNRVMKDIGVGANKISYNLQDEFRESL